VPLGVIGDVFEVMAQVDRRLTKVNSVDRIIRVNQPDRKPGASQLCSSQGDAVARYLTPHARRIADAPMDVVPQISWGNTVLACTNRGLCSGVLKGHSKQAILLGCPLLQLWYHERFTIGRPVVSLHSYEALPEGHDPSDRFTMGSLWCLRTVISYF
jgi:hypothetical protein